LEIRLRRIYVRQDRVAEVRPREVGFCEVGRTEIRSLCNGVYEFGLICHHPCERRVREIGTREVGLVDLGISQVGANQPSVDEERLCGIRVDQHGAAEIGATATCTGS
jgi:hypothetical protein